MDRSISLQVEKHKPATSMGRDSETLTTFWWGIRSGHCTFSFRSEDWAEVNQCHGELNLLEENFISCNSHSRIVNTGMVAHKQLSGWKYVNYQLSIRWFTHLINTQLLLPTQILCSLAKEPNVLIPVPQPSGKSTVLSTWQDQALVKLLWFLCISIFHTIFWNRREAQNAVTYNPEEQWAFLWAGFLHRMWAGPPWVCVICLEVQKPHSENMLFP